MASIEKRESNRGAVYVVRFRDDTGRQRSKSLPTKKEALTYAAQVESQLHTGEWIDPHKGRIKFGDFHARWVAARSVSASRASAERSQAKVHIIPRWSQVPLSRIKPLDVDRWIKDSPAGTATKTMMLAQFKLCLDAAVREGLIRTNPAATTKAPSSPKKRVSTTDVLDAAELDRLVAATPDRWKALVYLSGWLGWRWSEAMGLRLRDVDLDAGVIHVGNEVAVEADGVIVRRAGGKTDAATRAVPMPGPARSVAAWHIARHFSGVGSDGSMFVTESGDTPYRSNFRRIFQKAVRDAGLDGRGINVRQLRHTAASLMLTSGLDILDVQERLGHTRGSVTLDIYGRVLARRREVGTDAMTVLMAANSDTAFTHSEPVRSSDYRYGPNDLTVEKAS